jgi:monoterpene epsilon-lactone hydrolase
MAGDEHQRRVGYDLVRVDLTVTGQSSTTRADLDPALTVRALRLRAEDYLRGTDASDGSVSPIYADLTGLPPLLIQVGSHEILLDDAIRLAKKAAANDVEVTLEVVPGVPHVFQAFAAHLDEGEAALERAGAFLRRHAAG